MKTEILELLKKQKDFISGQQLCEHFGVSRTAVWKVINRLKEEGYVIESVNRKGYRIVSCPDLLSEDELLSAPSRRQVTSLQKLICLSETDSTNTDAKKEALNGAPDHTLVVADLQRQGKGRRGRSFDSPAGVGIFMTLLLRPTVAPNKASMLTLLAGMAVRSAIAELTGEDVRIKWPNDIVLNQKKICGILTEMSSEMTCINYVVIGIGINVNNSSFPGELQNIASSLFLETGKTFRRSELIVGVLHFFDSYYEQFCKTSDLSLLKEEYNKYMINKNRPVVVVRENESYEATAIGIDDDGELLIDTGKERKKVLSGEVSVRGVYGYV